MNKISNFFNENSLKSTFIILKKIDEKGKFLNFYGKGYSISFDFNYDYNNKKIKNFFVNLINTNNLKINYSKDIIQKYEFIRKDKSYLKFKKEINFFDKNSRINNEFSKRLKLKNEI